MSATKLSNLLEGISRITEIAEEIVRLAEHIARENLVISHRPTRTNTEKILYKEKT